MHARACLDAELRVYIVCMSMSHRVLCLHFPDWSLAPYPLLLAADPKLRLEEAGGV